MRKIRVLLSLGVCATLLLAGCGGQSTTTTGGAPDIPPDMESALHYIKASNSNSTFSFGYSMALSADGSTLAIGAPGESSDAVGINRYQNNVNRVASGAVYVFVRSGKTWVQQAYVKAANAGELDLFGVSVALSANGHTLAVGAHGEDSSTGSDPFDGDAPDAGAVYVFARDAGNWSQQVYLKADHPSTGDFFGNSVSLSGNGNTLAVGALSKDLDADENNGSKSDAGAAYVFSRTGVSWNQQALLKAGNAGASDAFGSSVSLSAIGDTLAVGASARSGSGEPDDDLVPLSGAAYVFTRTDLTWSETACLKASNRGAFDRLGHSIALSADGQTVAVGAIGEASSATTINGHPNDQLDNAAPSAGAVYVFRLSSGSWGQQAYVKASNAGMGDQFGFALALSSDGSTLMAGAPWESSRATGINGEQGDDSAESAGAVYVFTRAANTWSQRAYVKASNTDGRDYFGTAVAVSANGRTFAVGAQGEASKATGIDGDQLDNSFDQAGAVYLLNTLN